MADGNHAPVLLSVAGEYMYVPRLCRGSRGSQHCTAQAASTAPRHAPRLPTPPLSRPAPSADGDARVWLARPVAARAVAPTHGAKTGHCGATRGPSPSPRALSGTTRTRAASLGRWSTATPTGRRAIEARRCEEERVTVACAEGGRGGSARPRGGLAKFILAFTICIMNLAYFSKFRKHIGMVVNYEIIHMRFAEIRKFIGGSSEL